MATQARAAPTILRRKQVEERTGLTRSTIYEWVKEGTFPAPVHLGTKSVGWIEAEVTAWIEARIANSRKA